MWSPAIGTGRNSSPNSFTFHCGPSHDYTLAREMRVEVSYAISRPGHGKLPYCL